jgi:hypothetical protein
MLIAPRPLKGAASRPRLASPTMVSEAELDSARREWEDGHRRLLDQAGDAVARDRLFAQVDVVVAELRRRVGGVFTLRELAAAYDRAEEWSRAVVSEQAPAPGWPRTLSLVEAAAFHLYARGAQDYAP